MRFAAFAAFLFLADFTCPFGGSTPATEDPTPEQCDRQEGVCFNSCARQVSDGMTNPTSGAMQTCYTDCMESWADNCSTLQEWVNENMEE